MSDIKQVRSIIAKAGKKVFGVKFIKKDGSERVMSARLGVVSKLRGGDDSTSNLQSLSIDENIAKTKNTVYNLGFCIDYTYVDLFKANK